VDESLPDEVPGDLTAIEAMFMLETHGKEISCNQPRMLDALKKGKQSREFHIKAWLDIVRYREAQPEEFFGCLGLRSAEEFRSIFGRSLTLPLLRIIHRELGRQIETYENMCNPSANNATLSVATYSKGNHEKVEN
jgi:hypothetical protein